MYAIYTTPGFIIDSRPRGEAGKILWIFTRDLGLILATAEGIRFEKSKLRYHTMDYSFGSFSFVRGKEFWRLTSAAEGGIVSQEPYTIYGISSQKGSVTPPAHKDTGEFFARIALILRRFLHGEESHPELFVVLESCRNFLTNTQLNDEQLKTLESVIVLRILHSLGYVGKSADLAEFVSGVDVSEDLLEKALPLRKVINLHINKALKESQL